ncbi:hypothetical protein DSO57_1002490 [Entomophthora muscae]|uniref:Uncharacterized protein n=1 Tax=Entomophthora muscae TaxID=34485 RepID=A0ACC2SLG2_9FUNG|nr:hypothetical protein DSO57_1002490 [Entomophthora muscae]
MQDKPTLGTSPSLQFEPIASTCTGSVIGPTKFYHLSVVQNSRINCRATNNYYMMLYNRGAGIRDPGSHPGVEFHLDTTSRNAGIHNWRRGPKEEGCKRYGEYPQMAETRALAKIQRSFPKVSQGSSGELKAGAKMGAHYHLQWCYGWSHKGQWPWKQQPMLGSNRFSLDLGKGLYCENTRYTDGCVNGSIQEGVGF